ncbi:hypothetical protein [Thalassotalea sp. PLHSN55]|uniref:hypothetical protein n=1 Tax=Thalassotalea sp. PLHSN55 TaxID=3435888 RepID=UPI003F842E5C
MKIAKGRGEKGAVLGVLKNTEAPQVISDKKSLSGLLKNTFRFKGKPEIRTTNVC